MRGCRCCSPATAYEFLLLLYNPDVTDLRLLTDIRLSPADVLAAQQAAAQGMYIASGQSAGGGAATSMAPSPPARAPPPADVSTVVPVPVLTRNLTVLGGARAFDGLSALDDTLAVGGGGIIGSDGQIVSVGSSGNSNGGGEGGGAAPAAVLATRGGSHSVFDTAFASSAAVRLRANVVLTFRNVEIYKVNISAHCAVPFGACRIGPRRLERDGVAVWGAGAGV